MMPLTIDSSSRDRNPQGIRIKADTNEIQSTSYRDPFPLHMIHSLDELMLRKYPNQQTASCNSSSDYKKDEVFSYARHGRIEELETLLRQGLAVDVRDDNGNTILAIACQNGNKRVVKLALRYGADINAKNIRGNTPLHFCYKYGFADNLGVYLISKGADKRIRNEDNLTCADYRHMSCT
jgi:ankyrin repeat protein